MSTNPCDRWQPILRTILTEESLSSLEQTALHAHLRNCAECTKLDADRRTSLSALRRHGRDTVRKGQKMEERN